MRGSVVHVSSDPYRILHSRMLDEAQKVAQVLFRGRVGGPSPRADTSALTMPIGGSCSDHLPGRLRIFVSSRFEPFELTVARRMQGAVAVGVCGSVEERHVETE